MLLQLICEFSESSLVFLVNSFNDLKYNEEFIIKNFCFYNCNRMQS
jgi:hypothetical protein